jgi:hypothetical protein
MLQARVSHQGAARVERDTELGNWNLELMMRCGVVRLVDRFRWPTVQVL